MIEFLPGMSFISLLLLACLAFFVEKHHTQRWTVAANCVIIWSTLGLAIFNMNIFFVLWSIGSVVAAITAVYTYIKKESIDSQIHDLFHLFYSSKTVLGIILGLTLGSLLLAIPFVVVIWFLAVHYFQHKMPFFD